MGNRYTKASIEKLNILEELRQEVFTEYFLNSAEGPSFRFPSFEMCGQMIDGIGCHFGIDRTLYYDLYRGDEKIISMNDWRMDEFLMGVPLDDLQNARNELKPVEPHKAEARQELSCSTANGRYQMKR